MGKSLLPVLQLYLLLVLTYVPCTGRAGKSGTVEISGYFLDNITVLTTIHFWDTRRGLGTSDVAQDIGWSDSTSAAALAVATIVIPGIDAFFGSKKVEQWYDKVSTKVAVHR